jgi:hypothetical protein
MSCCPNPKPQLRKDKHHFTPTPTHTIAHATCNMQLTYLGFHNLPLEIERERKNNYIKRGPRL